MNIFIGALALSITITAIAWLKDFRHKSVIYSLPIPITIVLIAQGIEVNSSHILGLATLVIFLWLVFLLHIRFKLNIIISDIIACGMYVICGFLLGPVGDAVSFWLVTVLYFFIWLITMPFLRPRAERNEPSRFSPIKKGSIVFFASILLLFFERLLRGFVVTFPYSGIFTVVECRYGLYTLASHFTWYSLSILIFFVVIKAINIYFSAYFALLVGWLVNLLVFFIMFHVRRLYELRIRGRLP